MKRNVKRVILDGCLMSFAVFGMVLVSNPATTPMPATYVVAAQSLDDDLGQGAGTSDDSGYGQDNGVADMFKNHPAVTKEQMETASNNVSPITNIVGFIIGGIMAVGSVLIFLITALDLLYIGVPFVRNILYRQNGQGLSQFISDEAVACSALFANGGQPGMQGGMNGMQGGYGGMHGGYGGMQSGMGMSGMNGGMGMSGMNGGIGMQNGMQGQQQVSTKSVIGTYLKKRIVFLVLFALASVLLLSSALLGTGVNLAQWSIKVINMVNNSIPK